MGQVSESLQPHTQAPVPYPSTCPYDYSSLATYGVEEKVDLTPEESDPSKKKFIKKVTPLEDWILEQQTQNP